MALFGVLTTACTDKETGETGSTSTSDGSSTVQTGTGESGEEPTDTGTAPPADDTGEATAGDDTAGEDTAGDDTAGDDTAGDDTAGDDTAGDDTGFVPPSECGSPDGSVKAKFALELPAWPIDPEEFDIVGVPCEVATVTSVGGTVSTTLTCEFEGAPQLATLDFTAPPEGEVTWAAGDDVQLFAGVSIDALDMADARSVQLRASDESLLVSATDSTLDESFATRFAPLAVEVVRACGDDARFGSEPARLDFTPPGEPVVSIFSGQRGVVPLGAEQQFVIDVEEATTSSLHKEEEMRVLLRRVKLGG